MSNPSSYGLRLSDVRQHLDELPAGVRDAFWRALCFLSDVDKNHEVPAVGTQRYRNASPPFEIFYEIDAANREINVSQIAIPEFEPRVMVFISYAHKDRRWFQEFYPYMDLLDQRNQLMVCSDQLLETGEDFEKRICEFIRGARFAVLLVTQQFLTSRFISNREMPIIMEKNRAGTQEIHWIPFERAVFAEDSPFRVLQAAVPSDPPLEDLPRRKRRKAYVTIANALLARVEEATDVVT